MRYQSLEDSRRAGMISSNIIARWQCSFQSAFRLHSGRFGYHQDRMCASTQYLLTPSTGLPALQVLVPHAIQKLISVFSILPLSSASMAYSFTAFDRPSAIQQSLLIRIPPGSNPARWDAGKSWGGWLLCHPSQLLSQFAYVSHGFACTGFPCSSCFRESATSF